MAFAYSPKPCSVENVRSAKERKKIERKIIILHPTESILCLRNVCMHRYTYLCR